MSAQHWSDDELMARLYGVGPNNGHLEECAECAEKWRSLQAARAWMLEQQPQPVSEEFLARQRAEISQRLEGARATRKWFVLAPAGLAVAVVVLAVVLYRPGPVPVPDAGTPDADFYAEVYSLALSEEPEALGPMHALFEAEVNQ